MRESRRNSGAGPCARTQKHKERELGISMETDYISLLTERYPALKPVEADVRKAEALMERCYENGGKILVGGNGGSCADAEHFVGELMKGFVRKRKLPADLAASLRAADPVRGAALAETLEGALPAIAVTGHDGLTSAFGNDRNWQMAMAQQVNGYSRPGDVFLGITTSGNSENVLYAAVTARARGLSVIALTGKDGGKIRALSDVAIIVPLQETYQIQELHLPIYHALCLALEARFFPDEADADET